MLRVLKPTGCPLVAVRDAVQNVPAYAAEIDLIERQSSRSTMLIGFRDCGKKRATWPEEMRMERYRNLAGNSGVAAYEIGADSITVRFQDGDTYLYTNASAGADTIAEMKRLAHAGRGLSSFISRTVRDRYAAKLG